MNFGKYFPKTFGGQNWNFERVGRNIEEEEKKLK
jgi:hypothetical protein